MMLERDASQSPPSLLAETARRNVLLISWNIMCLVPSRVVTAAKADPLLIPCAKGRLLGEGRNVADEDGASVEVI